jgi:hypothetical protein
MRPVRLSIVILCALAASLAIVPAAGGAPSTGGGPPRGDRCADVGGVHVPGAAHQERACLADLTTAGTVATGHTVPAHYAGLHAPGTVNPSGVPGMQIDGYFPDTSTTNATHGWNHDAQFVIRLPDRWNGGLVITGAPGVRGQYANDFIIGDWVLAHGYAFASTDKGNTGAFFFRDGRRPGDAVVEWNRRVTQLTVAAKAAAAQRFGRWPKRSYVTGVSNGGGSSRTGRGFTTAASTGRARCSALPGPTC